MIAFIFQLAQATIIPVTTTADILIDDGECSLREALRSANADDAGASGCVSGNGIDTVQIGAGTYSLSLAGGMEDAGASGDLDVTSIVHFAGVSIDTTIIDGLQADRLVDVLPGGEALITDVTLQHGRPPPTTLYSDLLGGAIRMRGNVTLERVRMQQNHSGNNNLVAIVIGGSGGAIGCSGATLVANATEWLDNGVGIGVASGYEGDGGALDATDCTVAVSNSRFDGNHAVSGSMARILGSGAVSLSDVLVTHHTGGHLYVGTGGTWRRVSVVENQTTIPIQLQNGATWIDVTLAHNLMGDPRQRSVYMSVTKSSAIFRFERVTIAGNTNDQIDVWANINTALVEYHSSIIGGDCRNLTGEVTFTSLGYNVLGGNCRASLFDVTTSASAIGAPIAGTNYVGYAPLLPALGRGSCFDVSGGQAPPDAFGTPRPACGRCDSGAMQTPIVRTRVTNEAASAECANGGKRIELSERGLCPGGTADISTLICSGTPGPSGASSVAAENGLAGSTGASGATGAPGVDGADGLPGAPADAILTQSGCSATSSPPGALVFLALWFRRRRGAATLCR